MPHNNLYKNTNPFQKQNQVIPNLSNKIKKKIKKLFLFPIRQKPIQPKKQKKITYQKYKNFHKNLTKLSYYKR